MAKVAPYPILIPSLSKYNSIYPYAGIAIDRPGVWSIPPWNQPRFGEAGRKPRGYGSIVEESSPIPKQNPRASHMNRLDNGLQSFVAVFADMHRYVYSNIWKFPKLGVAPNRPFLDGWSMTNPQFRGSTVDGSPPYEVTRSQLFFWRDTQPRLRERWTDWPKKADIFNRKLVDRPELQEHFSENRQEVKFRILPTRFHSDARFVGCNIVLNRSIFFHPFQWFPYGSPYGNARRDMLPSAYD